MKPTDTIPYYRFSALLPVAEKYHSGEPTNYQITTLASTYLEAEELASNAGLVLLGQLDNNNNIITQQ